MLKVLLIFTAMSAQGTSIPVETTEGGSFEEWLAGKLVQAVFDRDWILLTAVLVMGLVFVFNRRILPKLNNKKRFKNVVPYLAVIMSMIGAAATVAMNKTFTIKDAVVAALHVALMAMGSWELSKNTGRLIQGIATKKKSSPPTNGATKNEDGTN